MDILPRIKALNLPIGKYIVFGSAVLEAHSIRKANDIDIVVNEELYKELKMQGWKRKWFFKRVLTCRALTKGEAEVFTNIYWRKYRAETKDLIKNAELIGGIPFMSLEDYLIYKKHLPRTKDIEDVRLIEKYLADQR